MMLPDHKASRIITEKYCGDDYEFFCIDWTLDDAAQEELVVAVEEDKEPYTANHFFSCITNLTRERMMRLIEVVRVHGRTHELMDTLHAAGNKLTKEERWKLITTIVDRDGLWFYHFHNTPSRRDKLFTPEEWAYAVERKDQKPARKEY